MHYTTPAQCAAELHSGQADLGLIPIAELTSDLRVVPGCVIASLGEVRSILLLVRNPGERPAAEVLQELRSLAVDTASRSSVAYVRALLQSFYNNKPELHAFPANPLTMLAAHEAALLIGDPALLAREHRPQIEAAVDGPLLWLDVAELWREHTGLPWVAAVWAVRPEALDSSEAEDQLVHDLVTSRNHGLLNIEELVREWAPRLQLSPATVHTYLTHNIHYLLDPYCLRAITYFRRMTAQLDILPPLPRLQLLGDIPF